MTDVRLTRSRCMENGRVVQQGTHEELISDEEGLYAKLCDAQ